jgi:hypothetical protein
VPRKLARLALPGTGAVKVADKSGRQAAGYVWSATRIRSGIRLRGSIPTDEDRRTVLGMVKALPDLGSRTDSRSTPARRPRTNGSVR